MPRDEDHRPERATLFTIRQHSRELRAGAGPAEPLTLPSLPAHTASPAHGLLFRNRLEAAAFPGALGPGGRHTGFRRGEAGKAVAPSLEGGKHIPFLPQLTQHSQDRCRDRPPASPAELMWASDSLASTFQPASLLRLQHQWKPGPLLTESHPPSLHSGSGPGELNPLGLATTGPATKNFRVHTCVPCKARATQHVS